jgi:D-alanyl-D-alanine carboxypeptidase
MRLAGFGVVFMVIPVTANLGCFRPSDAPETAQQTAAFQALIESVVAEDEAVPGASLAVLSPSMGIAWEGAAGFADPEARTPMTPAHPVRIASNTKTYTAAAALRLVETDRIDIDAAIGDLLPKEYIKLLESDGYDPSAITIRHLLTHTGGLYDHGDAEAYTEAIIADPTHHWTPTEQITALVEWGDKLDEPGRIYSYSDSGYVLLGVIIEKITGKDLAKTVRELVGFDRLGLDATWWEIKEPAPAGSIVRAHQFLGDLDVTDFVPYFDLYGGGGIATTMGDLARFHGAIFRGAVYSNPATVETMLSTIDGMKASPTANERALPPGAYRMGVWVLETEGLTTYHHTGFWGTLAVHVPELDLTIAATCNQNQVGPGFDRIPAEVVTIVKEYS